MTEPTRLEKVRMALAELGYEPHLVWQVGRRSNISELTLCFVRGTIPPAVFYVASTLGETDPPCWTCWSQECSQAQLNCIAGNCHNPGGPKKPPRELLRSANAEVAI